MHLNEKRIGVIDPLFTSFLASELSFCATSMASEVEQGMSQHHPS